VPRSGSNDAGTQVSRPAHADLVKEYLTASRTLCKLTVVCKDGDVGATAMTAHRRLHPFSSKLEDAMAFQSVPDVAEAVVAWTAQGETQTMTFYGLKTGYTQGDINALATRMDQWAGAELVPMLSTSLNYAGVTVKGLELLNDLTATDATNASAGSTVEVPLANQDCVAVARLSNFTGRSARGRVYMPLHRGNVDTNENFVTSSTKTAFEDALDEVSVGMISEGWIEVVVSRFTGGAPRTVGVTFTVVQYEMRDLEIDTQRRRMPGK